MGTPGTRSRTLPRDRPYRGR